MSDTASLLSQELALRPWWAMAWKFLSPAVLRWRTVQLPHPRFHFEPIRSTLAPMASATEQLEWTQKSGKPIARGNSTASFSLV